VTSFTKKLWHSTEAGVLIPNGSVSEASNRSKTNVLHVKSRAVEIEDLYADAGLTMSPTCGLAQLIDNAKLVADRWLTNQTANCTMIDVFYSLHLNRLADAILPLRDVPGKERYLNALTSGDLDCFSHQGSYAKNIFWELELWTILRRGCPSASLQDPPDIVLSLAGGTLGVACKKIYSEKNVEKVLSEAVRQVEGDFSVGVVALSLDELIPPETVLRVRNKMEMDRFLHKHIDDFITRHERHLRKYLSAGRLVSALVSVNVIADVLEWKVRFNNARSSLAWTIPGLPTEKEALLKQFRDIALVYRKTLSTSNNTIHQMNW
jgi:hypothetical protein